MATKFQNRLVGTVILTLMSVIILPNILDSIKHHYKSDIAAIQMRAKFVNSNEFNAISSASQQLSSRSSEDVGKAMEQSTIRSDGNKKLSPLLVGTVNTPHSLKTLTLPKMKINSFTTVKSETKPSASTKNKLLLKSQTSNVEALKPSVFKLNKATDTKQNPKVQSWVVQLGALKNADKVSKIVSKLKLSGYCVYTLPSVPKQGHITRIFVGPDTSQNKLQNILGELYRLSGLNGQLRKHNPH